MIGADEKTVMLGLLSLFLERHVSGNARAEKKTAMTICCGNRRTIDRRLQDYRKQCRALFGSGSRFKLNLKPLRHFVHRRDSARDSAPFKSLLTRLSSVRIRWDGAGAD